jgi:hypothetical protein
MTSPIPIPCVDPDTLGSIPGHLFKPSGKWKYEVFLDYRGILDEFGRPADDSITYLSPNEAALRALMQATEQGTSGVSLERPGGYHLVVVDPPNGFPVMVVGDGD